MLITPLFVLFNGIVFVLVLLFINTIDKRKWLTVLLSIVLTPLVFFYAFYPFINIFSNYHHQKYFKTEAWMEKPALRYEMSDHLMASDTLKNMSKKEVQQALGNYEWLGWNMDLKAHDNNIWNYSLGIEPGAFNSNKECLKIVFKNNKVVSINPFKEAVKFETED
ncbi:hypothetical protein A9Q87_12690 [Flavobacteriales bacterium 34_180_T64]|nr:hypothetical protein A9Q87_12690 [Flavobacteriales bacterium 34_180_T64]